MNEGKPTLGSFTEYEVWEDYAGGTRLRKVIRGRNKAIRYCNWERHSQRSLLLVRRVTIREKVEIISTKKEETK